MGTPKEPHSLKVPVAIQPTFTISFERSQGFTFIHCDIHGPWTAKVKQDLTVAFRALCVLHSEKIYAQHSPDDTKHEKFLKMFSFKFVEEFADAATGNIRHLYSIN